MPDRSEQEQWKNGTEGTVVLTRLDHRGEMTRHEVITGGRTFHITSEERRLNQERAAGEDLDVFRNGVLVPVRLLEGNEEARELASNPNNMSESDMAALFKAHHKTFASKLAQIRNPVALERLLTIARSEDASVSKVEAIQARLAEVSPSLYADPSDRRGPERGSRPVAGGYGPTGDEHRPRPVTPR